ncbi:zinc-binding dehydrogenase [Calothrix sp. FACHB-156]|nr:zinc-binding dehydrogenase [Calothrix sp. FACHB-156]
MFSPEGNKRGITYVIFTFKQEHHDWYLENLTTLLKFLAKNKIQPLIDKTMSLSEAGEAHHSLDTQTVRSKIVLLL